VVLARTDEDRDRGRGMGTEEPTATANQPESEHREEVEYNQDVLDDLIEMSVESSVNGLRAPLR